MIYNDIFIYNIKWYNDTYIYNSDITQYDELVINSDS